MSYALDITAPAVQEAMKRLGISASELRLRRRDSFADASQPEDVVRLRFTHYQRRLNNTVIQVRLLSQKLEHGSHSIDLPSPGRQSKEPKQSKDSLIVQKQRNKAVIQSLLEDFQKSKTGQESIDSRLMKVERLRKKRQLSLSPNTLKMKQFKEIQQRNFRDIRQAEIDAERAALHSPLHPSASLEENSPARRSSVNRSPENTDDALEALQRIEAKLARSTRKYEATLKSTRQQAAKDTQKIIDGRKQVLEQRNLESFEAIQSIIRKQKATEDRQAQARQSHQRKIAQGRRLAEEKQADIERQLQRFQAQQRAKIKAIEERLELSSQSVHDRRSALSLELRKKTELNRLRDEDAELNAQRNLRVLVISNQESATGIHS